ALAMRFGVIHQKLDILRRVLLPNDELIEYINLGVGDEHGVYNAFFHRSGGDPTIGFVFKTPDPEVAELEHIRKTQKFPHPFNDARELVGLQFVGRQGNWTTHADNYI